MKIKIFKDHDWSCLLSLVHRECKHNLGGDVLLTRIEPVTWKATVKFPCSLLCSASPPSSFFEGNPTLHHPSSQSQHVANGISNFQHVVFSFHVCFDQGSIDSTSNCCQCYLPPQKKQTFEPQLGTGSNSQIVATQKTTSFLKMPMQTVAMTIIQHPRKK